MFDDTINEVTKLYGKPELIAANSDVQNLFHYDNIIFSNLCKNKIAYDNIYKKIGLDKLLELGQKTGNTSLLNSILTTAGNYIKNTPNKDDIPEEVIEPTIEIIKKCVKLHDRNAPLMCKVLDLATLLNTDRYKPKVDEIGLIKSMNNDLNTFKGDHDYLNSCLNTLSKLTKDSPVNGQEALDCGLLKQLNDEVSNIVQEGPEKYEENKGEHEDENGYLKTCYNLSRLYDNLVKNDLNNVDKFNKMGITDNTVNMLKVFNDKVEPMTEEKRLAETRKPISDSIDRDEYANYLRPPELIRGIMKHCTGTLEQVTIPPNSNEYLANNTDFGDTMNKNIRK